MDYEKLATQLEATGDDRVLRRFVPADRYAPLDGVDPQHLRVTVDAITGRERYTDRYPRGKRCRSAPYPERPPPS